MQTLHDAYAMYLRDYAASRPTSYAMGPLTDFVELLREREVDTTYSDEDWIEFLLPFVGGDPDRARDTWDALLCQPSYADVK
jgi:hypothetical protein